VAEVRHAFTKAGGSLGTDGSVAYLFTKQGQINFPKSSNEERIMEVALEAGAEDISTNEDGSIDVVTTPETFMDVKQAMQDKQLIPEYSDIMMSAALQIKIDDLETAEKIIRLIDTLEDLDDVQNVYSNADISKEILERMQ
jgi:transcriptional/translational regulatory protein YebC/TACO1